MEFPVWYSRPLLPTCFKHSRVYMSVSNSWVGWLWWLLLCVHLTRDTQTAGETWFLGVSVEVFQEEISVWIGELSKTDEQMAFLNVGRCSQSFEGLKRTQRQRKVEFPLCGTDWVGTCLWHAWFSGLATQLLIYTTDPLTHGSLNYITRNPGSPGADGKLSHFSASIIMWADTLKWNSLYICVCVCVFPLCHSVSVSLLPSSLSIDSVSLENPYSHGSVSIFSLIPCIEGCVLVALSVLQKN